MTDNDLDLNDLNDLIPLNNQSPLSTENHITQAKMTRKSGLFFCRERRRKTPLEARKSGSDGTFHPFRRQKQEGLKAE